MTRDQINAIRARVEAATPGPWRASRWPSNNPHVIDAWGLSGMITFEDATFCGNAREDVPALLAEVERLTAEVESKVAQNVALVGMNGRLQQEVERLKTDPLPAAAWVHEVERAAFARGVAAMREAAAQRVASYRIKVMDPFGNLATVTGDPMPIVVAEIRALPDPEDKP